VMRRRGATAMTGEFDMGEGQVPKKANRSILSLSFSVANNDLHCLGRMAVGVGIVDRKRGHAN